MYDICVNVDNSVEIGDFSCFFGLFLYVIVRNPVDKSVNFVKKTILVNERLRRTLLASRLEIWYTNEQVEIADCKTRGA